MHSLAHGGGRVVTCKSQPQETVSLTQVALGSSAITQPSVPELPLAGKVPKRTVVVVLDMSITLFPSNLCFFLCTVPDWDHGKEVTVVVPQLRNTKQIQTKETSASSPPPSAR